jgi:LysR family positive regulator for ilvC
LERSRLDAWFKNERIDPHIVAEVRGNEGIIAMVSLGSGVGIVPQLVLDSSPLKQRVRVLDHLQAPPGYDVSLCCKKRSLGRRVVEVFWELSQSGEL